VPNASLTSGVLALGAIRPQPAWMSAVVPFSLPCGGVVRLEIYDFAGRLQATLLDGHADAGVATITWDLRDKSGRPVPQGITRSA